MPRTRCSSHVFWILVLGTAVSLTGSGAAQERRAPIKHPVLTPRVDVESAASYEKAVSRVMAMSEAEMLKLIPTQSPVIFCACPNCLGGQQEMRGLEWTIERPYELRCTQCGQTYPSEKYRPNRTATGTNSLGEPVSYRYYFDEKTGRDFWLEARTDHSRRDWFVSQCLALAHAYHATKKPEFARRAALILDRFAWAYPRMAVLNQWPYRPRQIVSPNPPYPHTGGKWGRWSPDEIPQSLPEAYDLIHDSDELDKLSREQKVDVRRRIENDFFRATVEHMFTFGKEPNGHHLNNMAPSYMVKIVNLGRILGDPEYVHWVHRWVGEIMRTQFFYDGMWCEAPSYHNQVVGGVRRVLGALKGYSDPPGYKGKVDGLHLQDVDLARDTPFLQKAERAPNLIAYANGAIAPVHDTWPAGSLGGGGGRRGGPGRGARAGGGTGGGRGSAARDQSVSTLLPGFGHASLGYGRGADQIQAQLHFSGAYGHAHADNLNLALFAKGSELLSDIGYNHGKLRHWTVSTIGHNTVAIDRRNQRTRDSDGDLLTFIPDLRGLAVVEARGERGYPGVAQIYRRQVLLVRTSDSDAYVVDIFRTKGGQTHDWLLHGSADADMTAECALPLAPREGTLLEPGEKWVEPIGETSSFNPYGVIREVRQGKTDDPFEVTFQYTGAAAGSGVRVHLLGGAGTEVFLGKSPRIRQAQRDDLKVYDYWMPQLVARRRGAESLASTFVAVHEPYRSKPFLGQVRSLSLSPAADFSAALEVRHGDYTDTIVSTLDEPPYAERKLPGGVAINGRLAVIRERGGQVVAMWLVDGTRVAKGTAVCTAAKPRHEGTIESAPRKLAGANYDAFVTTTDLPAGDALAGQWMIVTHANGYTHGYEIASVQRDGGKSIVVLRDDHGLQVKGNETEEWYFPRRKISGPNRFVIHTAAHVAP
jgi:hypothetical protein